MTVETWWSITLRSETREDLCASYKTCAFTLGSYTTWGSSVSFVPKFARIEEEWPVNIKDERAGSRINCVTWGGELQRRLESWKLRYTLSLFIRIYNKGNCTRNLGVRTFSAHGNGKLGLSICICALEIRPALLKTTKCFAAAIDA